MRISFLEILKRNKNIIFIALAVIIGMLVLIKFPKKEVDKKTVFKEDEVEYDYTNDFEETDTLENFGLVANENFVVIDDAPVRRTPNVAKFNTLYNLKFGTKVYTKNIDKENINNIEIDESLLEKETKNGFVAIYSVKPITLSDRPVGYIAIEDIIEKSEFKNFKPQPKRIEIDATILAAIQSDLVVNGKKYKLIEDNKRFNNSIAIGDYNNDGATDFAIILDTEDNSDSVFLAYLMDTEKNTYRLIFTHSATSYLKITTIPKQTPIIFKTETTSFPFDGIQITSNEPNPFYYFYTANTNSFTLVKI